MPSQLRVLIVSHYYPPHIGGLELVAQNQATRLAATGVAVTVLSSSIGQSNAEPSGAYRFVGVGALNLFEQGFGVPYPIFYPSLFWKTYQLVQGSDIVHIHDSLYLSSLAAAIWARVLKKPLVMTQHISLIPHPSKIVGLAQKLVYGTYGRFIFRTCQKVIVLNARVYDFVSSYGVGKSKIVTLPNGVDTLLFSPAKSNESRVFREKYGLPTTQKVALFVGRFVPKKGFQKLVDAASSNYVIAFVGGPTPLALETDSRLIFLGVRTQAELSEIYKACDVFVLPSEGEGFPLSVQEAMASGLPIITTDDPAYSTYNLDRTKVSLINPTPSAIRNALETVLGDAKVAKGMSDYSRKYALANFNWDTYTSQLNQLYVSL